MDTAREPRIAYFSMEIALEAAMPTYSGGLGVLAGDTIRSAADLGLRMVAVTLLHRRGYFAQRLDAAGRQSEHPASWDPEALLERLDARVSVEVAGREVAVRAWRYVVRGVHGRLVPVYLLDTDLPENTAEDRRLTDSLYGGDARYRLAQEIVLGMAGMRMLRALGHRRLDRVHMNEGHAALAVLVLLEERHGDVPEEPDELAALLAPVRRTCVFTTHTPVPAGHDQFPAALAKNLLGARAWGWLEAVGDGATLNMTDLALRASHFINGVAMRHGEVSRDLFPHYPIRSITNGIHPATWAAPAFAALFDRFIPEWRRDAFALRYAVGIPRHEIWRCHERAKAELVERVRREAGADFRPDVLTLGFARRATAYKRAMLVLRDPSRLTSLVRTRGPLQIVFAGKAHPRDDEGKQLLREIHAAAAALRGQVAIAYLSDYDMTLGRQLCAGVDVWLNTPVPPLEASGTSGMKAALNGVPSLSVLDGWWIEGCVDGVTGWAIGADPEQPPPSEQRDAHDAEELYRKLRDHVAPCYYFQRDRFQQMMRSAIALNASFFNTQRMVLQYLYDAYGEAGAPSR
jgi:starch phosphorylase